jgi:hypothetical protein
MYKKDIINKLQKFLQNHPKFEEECEAVYLLAEIRKIIEKNNKYKTLFFYCNWILHSKLNYKPTDDFLLENFNKYIDFSKSKKEIQRDLINGQKDFFKLKDLNFELNEFLKQNKLSTEFLKSNKWYKFCKLFLENIMECQIDFGSKTKYCKINRFSVEKSNSNYYYLFYLSNGIRIPRIILKFK